ncbi:Retrovirus-related Pol polyprotein from transposon TNT 1-94 [Gracilariopsis chorda]|uniref:Retrovirus-related Pol polyprotein from transposon TNT 1-94 n=1 Tax=Gracilariopsis chorda TaxID=448386 RepID=A0A2V3IE97_9FLOR|nr:Retrovirus-related Pol polyprotein from transposon TNT 1-94 [Gracilariopsis chorda]PXF45925.1 Retrovirus-related Pol polyprotein from transposon TNT 1-94 [Gracilariopsis chorda]|eukprot:PXF40372.1 Retrovirus-related Pol polyprotein from transposon TNT 1-94 [Gracilariopsis chorda]
MLQSDAVQLIRSTNFTRNICGTCAMAKQSRCRQHKNTTRAVAVGEIEYSYICRPMSVHFLRGSRFYFSFKDNVSGFAVIKPIQKKGDVFQEFKSFEAWAERKSNCMIEHLRSYRGGKYVAIKLYLK